MGLKKINPTKLPSWQGLLAHFQEMQSFDLNTAFEEDHARAKKLAVEWEDFYLDYSKNLISERTMSLLLELARDIDLSDAIKKYFQGDIINETENRAVLHTALRASENREVVVNGSNVIPEVKAVNNKMKSLADAIINGNKKGATGKAITTVVNVGIGGSDLGPAMVVEALKYYRNHLDIHFVSNVDGDHVNEVLKSLDPGTTLFIIVSKSFTTQETLSNATTIRNWFVDQLDEDAVSQHFVAVSSNIEKVVKFGIEKDNILPMWDWVGGRFSLWSAVGLSICLAVGYENYQGLLKGAEKMDVHFRTTDFDHNMPVILALLSIWYNNFFKVETEAVIAYSQYLNSFATYLQQAVMESNGKGVDRNGEKIEYESGTIVWGEPGTNSQHAFFQLIHQGTKLIPADFIGFKKSLHGNLEHHDKLMSNFFAQTQALMQGKTDLEVLEEFKSKAASDIEIGRSLPYKVFGGNRPTSTLLIDELSPESLGKLIALYEHKIFVQGVILNIYSYDQFGVELGKQLAGNILKDIENKHVSHQDSSTMELLKKYLDNQ